MSAELRDQAAEHTLAANPLVGVRPGSSTLLASSSADGAPPGIAAKRYLAFLGELGRIATARSELAPDAARFL